MFLTARKTKWQKWRKDVLRHTQTLFSSSWMPLWGSMKMTSLPWEVWLLCRNLTHLVWAVPISWMPISTFTCLVWAPFLPGRRWGWTSPGPGWILPSGGVPLLIPIFQSRLLVGFLNLVFSSLWFFGWPSTISFEGHLTNGHKNGNMPGQIYWSYSKISVLELQNSFGLTNIIILRRIHGIVCDGVHLFVISATLFCVLWETCETVMVTDFSVSSFSWLFGSRPVGHCTLCYLIHARCDEKGISLRLSLLSFI